MNIVIKYIPLTIVAVVSNLSPIFVVIFAFFLLKEQVKIFDVSMMLLTLVGILIMVLFHDTGDVEDNHAK